MLTETLFSESIFSTPGRAPGILLQTYHGGSLRERARSVAKVQRRGGVLLTSYGMIVSAAELLAKKDGESFGRDFSYVSVTLRVTM